MHEKLAAGASKQLIIDADKSNLGYNCFEILSFSILEIKVVRLSPSLFAAPLVPPMSQLVSLRVCRINRRSNSSSVRLLPVFSFCGAVHADHFVVDDQWKSGKRN